jgi:hypothetical protein
VLFTVRPFSTYVDAPLAMDEEAERVVELIQKGRILVVTCFCIVFVSFYFCFCFLALRAIYSRLVQYDGGTNLACLSTALQHPNASSETSINNNNENNCERACFDCIVLVTDGVDNVGDGMRLPDGIETVECPVHVLTPSYCGMLGWRIVVCFELVVGFIS